MMATSCGRQALNRFAFASGRKSLARPITRCKSSGDVAANQCSRAAAAAVGIDGDASLPVELFDVPKLPFVGSMIPQYSNTEAFDLTKTYQLWYQHRKKFGDFYSIGFPGTGKGITGTTYVMTDPNEFMKVMRKEGQHPYGAAMAEWPVIKYYKDGGSSPGCSAGLALFSQGKEWQRIRRFMQTDLLHPAAARGYVPGMITACQIASRGAPSHAKNFNDYTAFCSFDMFSSIVFGEFPGLAGGGKGEDQEENAKFCKSSLSAVERILPMNMTPAERIQNFLGMQTEVYTTFERSFNVAREIALRKLENFKERKANGELNEFEQQSYASLAIDRYLSSLGEEDALKEEDVGEMIVVALVAALDTTSSLLNWCIIHLAMNPNVQEELHTEISSNATANGGVLTEDCFSKSKTVYLNAVLRENHRISPPIAVNLVKENVTDKVEINGETIPKKSMCVLDTRSVGMDPEIVPNPDAFDPNRWSDDRASERRGTPAQVLDHPLYREPFSAGARKCPGSRVANYEAKVLLSQLVLDWKISFAEDGEVKSWRDVPYYNSLTVQPAVPELLFEKRQ